MLSKPGTEHAEHAEHRRAKMWQHYIRSKSNGCELTGCEVLMHREDGRNQTADAARDGSKRATDGNLSACSAKSLLQTNALGRLDAAPEGSLVDHLTSFLRPFTYELWGALLGVILLSGLADYLLEHKASDASLSSSVYEYAGGALWGGWYAAKSRMSAVYQVVISFVVLVTISA